MRKIAIVLCLIMFCVCCPSVIYGQESSDYETIFQEACAYMEEGRVEDGEVLLLALEDKEDVPARIRINSSIVLSNYFMGKEMLDKALPHLLRLRNYIDDENSDEELLITIEELCGSYRTLRLRQMPVSDRLCGTWVSTEADKSGAPEMIISISRDGDLYKAEINKLCWFSTMYKGAKTTQDITIDASGTLGSFEMLFADEKYKKGSKELAAATANAVYNMGRDVNDAIAQKHRKKPLSAGNVVGQTMTTVGTAFGMAMAANMAVDKTHIYMYNFCLNEVIPGVAELDALFHYIYDRSDGKGYESKQKRNIRMYKVEEDVDFVRLKKKMLADENCEIGTEEQRKEFNRQAYNRLYTIVKERYDEMLAELPIVIDNDFKYGPQRIYHTMDFPVAVSKLSEDYPVWNFSGAFKKKKAGGDEPFFFRNVEEWQKWYDNVKNTKGTKKMHRVIKNNMINSISLVEGEIRSCTDGDNCWTYYRGKFQKNRPHGKGELKHSDESGNVVIYVGEFFKGKKHGEGIACNEDGSNPRIQIWKKVN